jgi:hypothetical protein
MSTSSGQRRGASPKSLLSSALGQQFSFFDLRSSEVIRNRKF